MPTFVNLKFYNENERLLSTFTEFICWTQVPLSAINAGFGEAMRTIVDANLTALIAALALFQFGSGPVKGFAVTLGLGVVTNMFTAVYFSRFLVGIWYDRVRPAALPL